MGLSSSTSKSTTKPVYSKEIEGAAGDITNAYRTQQPKMTGITDQLAGLVPDLVSRYTNGDSGVNAARSYDADVLGGKYLGNNPYLDAAVEKTANTARNQTAGALGTRGLTGGSAFGDIISRNVADSSATMRLNDYSAERGRMDSAAGRAPSLAAAGELPLSSILSILTAQGVPVQNAAGAGSAIGGLLGQYTDGKQTQSMNLGSLIASLGGSALSAWAGGGFK